MVEYATLRESRFLKGVFLSGKQLSNSIEIRDARIALLSFPLQLPRLKTKHSFVASSLTDVADLYAVTKTFLKSVVSKLTSLHVTLVVCQWAVDDTVLSALKELGIGVIAYVSGQWMERVASASGGFVCARLDQLQAADLGSCPSVRYDADFDGVFLEAWPKQTSVGHLIVCGGTNTEIRRAVCDACLVLSKCVSTSAALGCFGGGRFETQLGKELAEKGHAIVAAALQSIAELLTPQTSDEDAVVPLAVKLGWIGRAIDVICMVLKIDAIVS
jgi:chaperonin GroEL (HSP60 family)